MSENVKTFYFSNGKQLNKWLHQNKAVETGEVIEGTLLDSFLVQTQRGHAAIYVHYVNPGKSIYRVEFEAGEARTVLSQWDQAVVKAEANAEQCERDYAARHQKEEGGGHEH